MPNSLDWKLGALRDAILPVGRSPVARICGLTVRSHAADSKNSRQRGGNVEALAAIVSNCSNKQDIVPFAKRDSARQDVLSLALR